MPKKQEKSRDSGILPKEWKGVWHFIWEDNSLLSWIVNVVLAFVIIKFLLYPGLGLALGTDYPIVAVVSGSMEHPGGFDSWWGSQAICGDQHCTQSEYYAQEGVTREKFKEFPFKNGFNKGDIIFLKGTEAKDIEEGDILVFKAKRPDPIIHRVMDKWQTEGDYYFRTKGDNNPRSYSEIMETSIPQNSVVGKAKFRVPFLGWVKLIFVEAINIFR